MNDINIMFKQVYSDQVSYLLIDETVVNWSSRHKLLPIKLQQPDYMAYKWFCQEEKDVEIEDGYPWIKIRKCLVNY